MFNELDNVIISCEVVSRIIIDGYGTLESYSDYLEDLADRFLALKED